MINKIEKVTSKYEFIAMKSKYLEEQIAQLVITHLRIHPAAIPPGRGNYWALEAYISPKLKQLNEDLDDLHYNNKLTKIQKYKQRLAIMETKLHIIETELNLKHLHIDNLHLTDYVYYNQEQTRAHKQPISPSDEEIAESRILFKDYTCKR